MKRENFAGYVLAPEVASCSTSGRASSERGAARTVAAFRGFPETSLSARHATDKLNPSLRPRHRGAFPAMHLRDAEVNLLGRDLYKGGLGRNRRRGNRASISILWRFHSLLHSIL